MEEAKPKREPNKWQLFLTGCLKEQTNGGLGEKVSACSVVYKDLKEKNPDKLEEIIAMARKNRESKIDIK